MFGKLLAVAVQVKHQRIPSRTTQTTTAAIITMDQGKTDLFGPIGRGTEYTLVIQDIYLSEIYSSNFDVHYTA